MKNLLRISLVLVALLAIVTTVNAATADEFVAYVSAPQKIAGQSVTLISASDKANIERYLATNKLSESDLDYLKGKFDEGVKIMDEAGVTDYKKLSSSDKAKITAIANEASAKLGIKFQVTSDGVKIYNLDGNGYILLSDVVKQTGSSNYIYLVPVVAIAAVAMALVYRRRLADAR